METKYCPKCETYKPVGEFAFRNTTLNTRAPHCKVCYAAKRREVYHTRDKAKIKIAVKQRKIELRKRFFEWKESLECTKCGEDDSNCLDFHHTDSKEKDIEVSSALWSNSWGWERLMKEVNKCMVVCRNCHAKIHAGTMRV